MVQIGSEHEALRLVSEPSGRRTPDYVLAELRSDGLTATRRVFNGYASGFHDLAECFGGLAADWRGWEGEGVWESIEGDSRIVARHEHGHIQLRVTVSGQGPGWGNQGWIATADLTPDPGEQLSQVASRLADLVHGSIGG